MVVNIADGGFSQCQARFGIDAGHVQVLVVDQLIGKLNVGTFPDLQIVAVSARAVLYIFAFDQCGQCSGAAWIIHVESEHARARQLQLGNHVGGFLFFVVPLRYGGADDNHDQRQGNTEFQQG